MPIHLFHYFFCAWSTFWNHILHFWQCLAGTTEDFKGWRLKEVIFPMSFLFVFIYLIMRFSNRWYTSRSNVKITDRSPFESGAFSRHLKEWQKLLNTSLYSRKPSHLTNKRVCTSQCHCLTTAKQLWLTSLFSKAPPKKIEVCVCVCVRTLVPMCEHHFRNSKARAPITSVEWEINTCVTKKWIRKHRGHNYQAPWCWTWRRWSGNRSVSNHPLAACPL